MVARPVSGARGRVRVAVGAGAPRLSRRWRRPLARSSKRRESVPSTMAAGPARGGFSVVSAYILIQTEVGRANHVTREISGIKGIMQADGVTGPYDVIARGEAADLDELAKAIVMPIQSVEGVTRTLTCPVLQF